jgi:hypothetical protein
VGGGGGGGGGGGRAVVQLASENFTAGGEGRKTKDRHACLTFVFLQKDVFD